MGVRAMGAFAAGICLFPLFVFGAWICTYKNVLRTATNSFWMRLLPVEANLLCFFILTRLARRSACRDAMMRDEARALCLKLQTSPPQRGSVCFIGSSTFTYWRRLAEDMAGLPTYNASFGGSMSHEPLEHLDGLVFRHAPSVVVYFCGTNDLLARAPPALVLDNFRSFVQAVRQWNPAVRIIYLNITLTPFHCYCGAARVGAIRAANALVAEYAAGSDVTFVDTSDDAYEADLSFYLGDGHHLNDAGHTRLAHTLRPAVEAAFG